MVPSSRRVGSYCDWKNGQRKWPHVVRGRPHLAVEGVKRLVSEQARLVKTVKVHITSAEGGYGSDRRIPAGKWTVPRDGGRPYPWTGDGRAVKTLGLRRGTVGCGSLGARIGVCTP